MLSIFHFMLAASNGQFPTIGDPDRPMPLHFSRLDRAGGAPRCCLQEPLYG